MNSKSKSVKLHCSSCGKKRWGQWISDFFKAYCCGHLTHIEEIYPKGIY